MAFPLPLLLLAGGALFVASQQKPKAPRWTPEEQKAIEVYIATTPLDPSLTPEQAQAVRVAASAAYLGKRSLTELAGDASTLATTGHPMAAAYLTSLIVTLQSRPQK